MEVNNLIMHNKITTDMLLVMSLGLTPLVLIVIINYLNADLLVALETHAHIIPSVISSNNYILSKSMDMYIKTGPLLAVLFTIFKSNHFNIKPNSPTVSLIISIFLYYIIYIVFIYLIIFSDHDIATSGRLLKIMASNDYSLIVFYAAMYTSTYILTVMLFWFSIGVCRELKKRC